MSGSGYWSGSSLDQSRGAGTGDTGGACGRRVLRGKRCDGRGADRGGQERTTIPETGRAWTADRCAHARMYTHQALKQC